MQRVKAAGSMAWKTREKVLAQGMPLGSLSHLRSQHGERLLEIQTIQTELLRQLVEGRDPDAMR